MITSAVLLSHLLKLACCSLNVTHDRFTLSGRVVGAVGGESCPLRNGGPSNVKVDLLSSTGDIVSSVLTSSEGSYLFKNIVPGMHVEIFL